MRKKTQEEFINECLSVHGTTYGLEKAIYTGFLKKVTVTCPIHGDFDIRVDHFLRGTGCHKCAKEAANERLRITNEEFVKRAREVHNDKYSYEKCNYCGFSKKVIITCPIHGDFEQRAGNHLNGGGCPVCGKENAILKHAVPFDVFVERANLIHNKKYKYIKNDYRSCKDKVEIVCPIHGNFKQQGWAHLNGEGCPLCGKALALLTIAPKTLEEFVKDAKLVHNNAYTYDKTVYINNYTKAIFTCPIHGDFEQTPHVHLSGCGCPKCKMSKLEKETMRILDQNNIKYIFQAGKANLKWIGQQRLDFYLVDKNIAIECQGVQHYIPVDFANKGEEWALEKFDYTKKLDKKKRKKCLKNNVILEYIKYDDNVEEKLNEILLKKN